MTDIDPLRSAYVTARREAARSRADVSQATTLLAQLEAAAATARRGEAPAGLDRTLAALDAELDAWDYDVSEIPADGEAQTVAVSSLETLAEAFRTSFEADDRERFERLRSLPSLAGRGTDDDALTETVETLTAAFDDDPETFEKALEDVEATLADARVDVEALATAAKTDRDALGSLQSDPGRETLLEGLEAGIEEPESGLFAVHRRALQRAIRAIEAFGAARREDQADLTEQLTDAYPTDPEEPLSGVAGETPVLMLPTRLETRFTETSDGPADFVLKIRVYPDDVHVDTHERELTEAEVTWGTHFWQQVWWASHEGDPEALRARLPADILAEVDLEGFPEDPLRRHAAVLERAWNQLAERFGPERAAWVKRELAPPAADDLLDWTGGPVPEVDFEAMRAGADRRPESWTRPPTAAALPDQWVAFAEINGTTETARSEPVRRPLSIGPDPDVVGAATGDPAEGRLQDGEMDWVFDFDAAVEAGMGLRLPLSAAQVSAGVDRLVVLGVSTALDATDGATEIADLLDAHQYTDGLSFVERGTPTNDTRDGAAGTAPTARPSPFEMACGPARDDPAAETDGARAAALLGLDPSSLGSRRTHVFGGVVGATGTDDAAAQAVNAALWPATWGYSLPHMLAPERWTDSVQPRPEFLRWLESYRRHFVSYVRAGGPLPTLRVGDQPYGILPTTDLDAWTPVTAYSGSPDDTLPATRGSFTYERLDGRDVEANLVARLRAARDVWDDALKAVPSIETDDDPEPVVLDILAMAGTSYGYRLRDLLGGEVMGELLSSSSDLSNAISESNAAVTSALQQSVPGAETPRVSELLAVGSAPPVHEALVAEDLDAYLRALRTSPHGALREGPPGMGLSLSEAPNILVWLFAVLFDLTDASLSEVLFYHGLAQAYRLARVRLAMGYEPDTHEEDTKDGFADTPWALFPEPELYDDGDVTLWTALDQPVSKALARHPDLDAETTYGEALRSVPDLDRGFAAVIDALERIESLETARAARLVAETLDLSSHRFDAWATSVATRRLDGLRERQDGGLYVGAYGYVEDLKRQTDSRSKGYVQAPSVGQATTAAVLRSGYDGETDAEAAFAVDLSPERVRDAHDLVEAVRAGRPLGEVLGYRFERALHEDHPNVELDRFVPVFRALVPLTEGKVDRPTMAPSPAAAEREILDGVALVDRWREGTIPWGTAVGTTGVALPPSGDPAYEAVTTELDALETALDAVSDVLTAESVHQLVSGNPERAGGSLDALSRGEAPPELSVTETPRTGTTCTHRLLTLLDADGSTWGPSDAPRAVAEPALNNWAGQLLGDPDRVVCRVAFQPRPTAAVPGADTDTTVTTPEWHVAAVRLSSLSLCPLDLVYLVEGDGEAWQSELEERLAYHVRATRSDVDPAGDVRISFEPPAAWPDPAALGVDPEDAVGFGPFLEAVRGVRELVTSARPADGRDVTPPDDGGDRGLLRAPLVDRAEAVEATLSSALETMTALTALYERPDEESDAATPSVADRFAALAAALGALRPTATSRVRRRLGALDPAAIATELDTLARVAAERTVLFQRDKNGTVLATRRTPTVTGLTAVRRGTDVTLVARVDGRTHEFESTVGRDGVFEAKLPEAVTDALGDGERFDLRVAVAGIRARTTVELDDRRGVDLSFAGPALRRAGELGAALEALAAAVADIEAAGDDVDGPTLQSALTAVDTDTRARVEAVLDAPEATVPGLVAPDGWATLGPVLTAVVVDGLTRSAIASLAGLDGDPAQIETLTEDLGETVAEGLDTLGAGVTAAEADPASGLAIASSGALRDALLVGADAGIHGSVPLSAAGATDDDMTALVRQADSVATELRDRLETAADAGDDAAGQRDRIEALFEDAFEVLAPFRPANAGELGQALAPAHERQLLDDPLAAETWFGRVARVRDVPRTLGRALTYGESLGSLSPADGSRFQVTQLPYEAGETWVGEPAAWDGARPTGKLSLVAHVQGEPASEELVGLFVDEFVETVPSETETTGLSFHYDKPGNRAPQSMLLAVPPTDEDWSLRTLADVVTESVDLAKLRTVDRDAMSGVGHLLPAMTVATNESTDGPDTASVDADALGPEWWYRQGNGGEN